MPMVDNPIYEGAGAIYEEIPGESNCKANLGLEREEGYVSISSSATINVPKRNGVSKWGCLGITKF